MKPEGMEALANSAKVAAGLKATSGGAGATGVSAYVGFLSENYQAIAAFGVLFGMVCTAVGLIYTIWHGQQVLKRQEEKES